MTSVKRPHVEYRLGVLIAIPRQGNRHRWAHKGILHGNRLAIDLHRDFEGVAAATQQINVLERNRPLHQALFFAYHTEIKQFGRHIEHCLVLGIAQQHRLGIDRLRLTIPFGHALQRQIHGIGSSQFAEASSITIPHPL